jgi:hypothetical protein
MHGKQSLYSQLCEWWTFEESFQVQPSQEVRKSPISCSEMGVEPTFVLLEKWEEDCGHRQKVRTYLRISPKPKRLQVGLKW